MPKYIMTREEREQAIKDFTAALPLISDRETQWLPDNTRKHRFICIALDNVTRDRACGAATATHLLVRRSLEGHTTYEGWLGSKGIDYNELGITKIQKNRKRWIRVIIKALRQSLKDADEA